MSPEELKVSGRKLSEATRELAKRGGGRGFLVQADLAEQATSTWSSFGHSHIARLRGRGSLLPFDASCFCCCQLVLEQPIHQQINYAHNDAHCPAL